MCRNVGAFLTIYNVACAAPSPFNRTTENNNEAWAAPVDFGILDAEGWTIESFYVDSTVHGTPRRAAPNASSLRVAVALVVGGKRSYAHFAIATVQSLRANGYDGDIVVFSQWVGPESGAAGCTSRLLRRAGVIVRKFGELLAEFPYPKPYPRGNRSPAWSKLGILWNDFLRRTYDRVFFADVDQFYNIDIRDVLERDLPPRVAIAMCNDGCSRETITLRNGQPPFRFIDRKQATCSWACARGKARRPTAKTFQQCDNLGWGTNRNVATRSFWTRFPRKNLAYQSGVFLVDYAKLPPPGETRSAAKLLFERFPRLWRGFGDQEFFANLFYDSAAILPECYVLPMSMHHVFHNNVDKVMATSDKNGTTGHWSIEEYHKMYRAATGLDQHCVGPDDLAPVPAPAPPSGPPLTRRTRPAWNASAAALLTVGEIKRMHGIHPAQSHLRPEDLPPPVDPKRFEEDGRQPPRGDEPNSSPRTGLRGPHARLRAGGAARRRRPMRPH